VTRARDLVRPPPGPVAAARAAIRRGGPRGAARMLGLTERTVLLVGSGAQAPRSAYLAILRHLVATLEGER